MFRNLTTAVILALTITAAHAGDSVTVTVRFGDLDLTKANDAQLLDSRVHAAAASVCASDGDDRYPVLLQYSLPREKCIARVSQTISAKVLAMSGQSRKLAGK